MKKLTSNSILILLLFFLTACSYKINRRGYKAPEEKLATNPQKIIFKMQADLDSINYEKVGSVELKDNGLTSNCHENDALARLKVEAFYAGGQLINIVEENRSDVKSTCYRCKADIYRIKNDSLLKSLNSDTIYAPQNLQKRVAQDRKKNNRSITGAIVGGILGGIIGGLLAASL